MAAGSKVRYPGFGRLRVRIHRHELFGPVLISVLDTSFCPYSLLFTAVAFAVAVAGGGGGGVAICCCCCGRPCLLGLLSLATSCGWV